MIAQFLNTPAQVATLGAFQHSQINAQMRPEIAKCMQDHSWTCHVCGMSIPGMMEIDHLKGHSLNGKAHLAPICQFCHDQKHLTWAASRRRVRMIHAPDMSQEQVSQLVWTVLIHNGQPGCTLDLDAVQQDFLTRATDATDILGCENLEPFLEALLIFSSTKGMDAAMAKANLLDAHLRVAPEIIFDDTQKLSNWKEGGFIPIEETWKEGAVPKGMPAYPDLMQAGKVMQRKL